MNFETNNTNEKVNLLNRLRARFYSTKIYKGIVGLALASSMILSAGCSYFPTNPNNPNNTDTNPSQTDSQGNPTQESTNSTDKQLEEYSELLQSVLNNEHYNSLIDRAKAGNEDIYERGEFKPHPYAFLEDEGFDVDAIMSGQIPCYSSSYVIKDEPNNLYIKTNIQTNSSTPYYTQYLIKYTLSDQEMKEYHMLHEGFYVQSFFMNDAISDMKTPTIVSETRITVEACDNITASINKFASAKELLNGRTVSGILLKSFDVETGTFEVIINTGTSIEKSMITSGYVNTAILSEGTHIIATNEDNAFYKPSKYGQYGINPNLNTSKPKQIILYQPITNYMTHTLDFDK